MVCSMKSYKGIFEFLKIASICEINKKIKFKLVLSANQEEIDNFFNDVNIGKNVSILPTNTILSIFMKIQICFLTYQSQKNGLKHLA